MNDPWTDQPRLSGPHVTLRPMVRADRDAIFGDCPKLFESAEIWPDKPVYGKFSRIGMSLGAYTAGPYAEGSYDLEIIIPKGLKALVKPQYQALFPG